MQHIVHRVGPLEGADREGTIPIGKEAEQARRGAAIADASDPDVGQHLQARHEIELLEDHGAARAPFAQPPAAQGADIDDAGVIPQDAARRRVGQPVDHAQQRRFPGAGAIDDPDHLARRNVEGDVVDGRYPHRPLLALLI